MPKIIDDVKLAKLREYYYLSLMITWWNKCDDRHCSEGFHMSNYDMIIEIPSNFSSDSIDSNGIYLDDWHNLPEVKQYIVENPNSKFLDPTSKTTGLCILKEKVNYKRDINALLN